MATIGPQLKAARESLGISTAEAARRLHMRAMFVDALEREDWKTVGEPVYVRGFVRNYARLLGLDANAIVDAFNDCAYAENGTPKFDVPFVAADTQRGFRYPWLLSAMSLIAVVLVAKVVWTMATPGSTGHDELHPSQASAMTSGASLPVQVAVAPAGASHPQQGVDLRLELTQACWLSVKVDGKRVVYETLPAGTVKEFHGVREISLRAGNAGGVIATIDGRPLGTLGDPGQVQDRVFAVRLAPSGQQNSPHE